MVGKSVFRPDPHEHFESGLCKNVKITARFSHICCLYVLVNALNYKDSLPSCEVVLTIS